MHLTIDQRDAMCVQFVPLAARLARRFSGPGYHHDDAFSDAMLGLFEAANAFDPSHRAGPFTFCYRGIRQRLLDGVARQARYGRDRRGNFFVRDHHRQSNRDRGGETPSALMVEGGFEAIDRMDLTHALMQSPLTPQERAAMKRKLEGLTNRETAKAMGISSGRVDQLYQAGLQRMKRRSAEAAA